MNEPDAPGTMTFWEHLEELRTRVVRAVLAVILGFGVSWYFKAQILEALAAPYIQAWHKSGIAGPDAIAPPHRHLAADSGRGQQPVAAGEGVCHAALLSTAIVYRF